MVEVTEFYSEQSGLQGIDAKIPPYFVMVITRVHSMVAQPP